jgi:protein TonB
VILQFIVCTDGTVCNIEAISGPEVLRKTALEAIKNTPNWKPAVQKGKFVKSYKKQPIVFRLERE